MDGDYVKNMSFRLSPYKVIRILAVIAVVAYAYAEISEFKKNKVKKTDEVIKTLDIRKKDFFNSDEEKNKLAVTQPEIAEMNNDKSRISEVTEKDEIKEEEKSSLQPETAEKIEAQKKTEEEAQKKIVNQIAQQKKAADEKKAQEQKEAAAKKAKEKAAAEAKKKNTETKTASKKYIQVATLNSEAAAKKAVNKLGGNFNYQKISGKKTLYVIVSISTDSPSTLSSLERQVKSKLGITNYEIRTVGK